MPLAEKERRARALFFDDPGSRPGPPAVTGRARDRRARAGPGRLDDARGERRDRQRRAMWSATRPISSGWRCAPDQRAHRERQSGRTRPRPARACARRRGPRRRRRLGRRSGRLRHGGGGVRGDRRESPSGARSTSRVAPGVSAMQAAAARLGAPLGHDFCAISLSDNLKPWASSSGGSTRRPRAISSSRSTIPPRRRGRSRIVEAFDLLRALKARGDAGRLRPRGRARRRDV